tara:strand:+ start:215 stop:463 length:249 start_codon:yes stop_codon:yes gene_type:complete
MVIAPDLPETLNDDPETGKVAGDPTLNPIVSCVAIVTVDNPDVGVDTFAPEKLIEVIDVPTLEPPCFNSTPEITLVRLAPEP